MRMPFLSVPGCFLFVMAIGALPANGVTLASNTGGPGTYTFVPGQSVSVPLGGPYNNITFNFYDPANNPLAAGDLFILSKEYLGTPAALSAATPGFIAESTGVLANHYVFNPSVTLQGATQYFFYADQSLLHRAGVTDIYSGGILYSGASTGTSFLSFPPADENFTLSGTAVVAAVVPEPTTFALALLAVPGIGWWAWKQRRQVGGGVFRPPFCRPGNLN